MDEEIRQTMKDFKDENNKAHDEIKELIKCLPCSEHKKIMDDHNVRLALIEAKKTTTNQNTSSNNKIDWKIITTLCAVIVTLALIIKEMTK